MIPSIRKAYNQAFSEPKYQNFLRDLNSLYGREITFRVAETPVFVGKDFETRLRQAGDDIIDFLVRPDFKALTEKAIPPKLRVPRETERSLFLALDFGVVDIDGMPEPRLIEMQGFPSLFGWQDVLSAKYREHFAVPAAMQSHFGLSSTEYRDLLKRVLLNEHDPREVILLEIEPMKQNTAVDFLATEVMTGITAVHIGDVTRKGNKLYYPRDGQSIEIKRIYNRVIFDELVKRTDLKLDFNLTEDVDVEWAGHPNWFFRISKYTMPMIKSRYIPECRFLSEFRQFPPDLENYVLKPLFSFSGSGVVFHVTPDDIERIPDYERSNFMLQRKVQYLPVVQAPDGLVKVEIRLLYLWEPNAARPRLVTNLARLSRGEMIGVKYNKDKTWVGGSVCFFEP
ncbi:MAG: hypothetical protein JNN04_05445 [Cyclobacteriaceae bacterium]|nr:hypothetical protein [Cyclobacteriaceae bacterium]